jgi:hypothetical protein
MSSEKRHISESSHWYRQDGTPCYEVEGKGGKKVKTTIVHARKMNLYPSVTTITSQVKKEFVDNWRIEMYLKQAFELACDARVYDEWRTQVMEAVEPKLNEGANRGTEIHGAIEAFLTNQSVPPAMENVVNNVKLCLANIIPQGAIIHSEKSFALKEYGYAGKMDIAIQSGDGFILGDFKTTSGKSYPNLIKKPYEDWSMQLSAYGKALPNQPSAYYSIIINRDTDDVKEFQWSAYDIGKGWDKFINLLSYWQIANNYRPQDVTDGTVMPF